MNGKLKKILADAEDIGDEELAKLYIEKEMSKIEDEITDADIEEVYQSALADVDYITNGIKELEKKR